VRLAAGRSRERGARWRPKGAGNWIAVLLLAIARHTGIRLAELGFLLAAIAGGLLVIVAIVPVGRRVGTAFAGLALAGGGILMIVATHWGHFG
jgi:ABC-type branched-subunit amino acid transport system permease subunit